jgi:hypothetical protein
MCPFGCRFSFGGEVSERGDEQRHPLELHFNGEGDRGRGSSSEWTHADDVRRINPDRAAVRCRWASRQLDWDEIHGLILTALSGKYEERATGASLLIASLAHHGATHRVIDPRQVKVKVKVKKRRGRQLPGGWLLWSPGRGPACGRLVAAEVPNPNPIPRSHSHPHSHSHSCAGPVECRHGRHLPCPKRSRCTAPLFLARFLSVWPVTVVCFAPAVSGFRGISSLRFALVAVFHGPATHGAPALNRFSLPARQKIS